MGYVVMMLLRERYVEKFHFGTFYSTSSQVSMHDSGHTTEN